MSISEVFSSKYVSPNLTKKEEIKTTKDQVKELTTQEERDTATAASLELVEKSSNARKKAKQRANRKKQKENDKAKAVEDQVNNQKDPHHRVEYHYELVKGEVEVIHKKSTDAVKIPKNFFTEEEDTCLKEMFTQWHLDYELTYFDIWGLHFNQLMEDFIKETKKSSSTEVLLNQLREDIFKNFLGNTLLQGDQPHNDDIVLIMKRVKDRFENIVFAVPHLKQLQLPEKYWLKRVEAIKQKLIKHCELNIKVFSSYTSASLIFYGVTKFPHGFLLNQGNPLKRLKDLISFSKYYYLLHQTTLGSQEPNPFKEIAKDLENLHHYMSITKLTQENLGDKFLNLLGKLNQKINSLTEMKQNIVGDVVRILSAHIISPLFPSYMSESDFIANMNNNILTTLNEATQLKKQKMDVQLTYNSKIDDKDKSLLNLLNQIKEDHRCLFLSHYHSLAHQDLHIALILFSSEMHNPYTKGKEVMPYIACFDPKRNLEKLSKELKELNGRHIKQISELIKKLDLKDKKEIRNLIEQFKDNCSTCCQFLAAYIVALKNMEFLTNFDKNTQDVLKGKTFLVPKELVDYMELEGLETLVFPKNKTSSDVASGENAEESTPEDSPEVSDDETEEFNPSVLHDDDSKEEKEDEKEVPKKSVPSKAELSSGKVKSKNQDLDLDNIAYPSKARKEPLKHRTKQEKSDRQKRRKVMQRLQSFGCIPISGKGSHTKMYDRKTGHLKSVVPHHGTIAKGTLGSINKSVDR